MFAILETSQSSISLRVERELRIYVGQADSPESGRKLRKKCSALGCMISFKLPFRRVNERSNIIYCEKKIKKINIYNQNLTINKTLHYLLRYYFYIWYIYFNLSYYQINFISTFLVIKTFKKIYSQEKIMYSKYLLLLYFIYIYISFQFLTILRSNSVIIISKNYYQTYIITTNYIISKRNFILCS
jgi:hypothetical protein